MSLYLRNTLFLRGKRPLTIVIPEDAAKPNIWAAANGMRIDSQKDPPRVGLIDVEVFEWDGDFVSASLEADRRAAGQISEVESHKNTLHDHMMMIIKTGLLASGALLGTERPSPLEKKDIMDVFLKIVQRPEYDGYVLSVHDTNGEPVQLHVDRRKS